MWTLIIFTRWPEPGRTKTRLIPVYGANGAASIHRQMIAHTVRAARELPGEARIVIALADAPNNETTSEKIRELFDPAWRVFAQQGDVLGARMANAIDAAFDESADCDRVVLVGVDCPDYSRALFLDANESLMNNDIVFAPTEDGGYGLVGVSRHVWNHDLKTAVFEGVPWGSAEVMSITESRLRERETMGAAPAVTIGLLSNIWDIDRPDDVERAISLGVLRRGT